MEVSKEVDETEVNEIEKGQKSTENNEVGEITLEQFKTALESNIEIKGYYDSVVDKAVNKRLDKSIESWKEKNLNQLIEEEVNKRNPKKSKIEIELEEAIKAKRQLELQVQYQELITKNNLPLSILEFVAGKDVEDTVNRTERFNNILSELIEKHRQEWAHKWLLKGAYTPPGENGFVGEETSDIWKLMR